MPDRLYNIIHEINSSNYQILSDNIEYSIFFPNSNPDLTENVGSNYFTLVNIYDNIDVKVLLNNYNINNIFNINDKINQISIRIALPNGFELENINDQIILVKKDDETIFNITSSSLVDSVGDNTVLPSMSISRDSVYWNIKVDFNNDWINDQNRIFPLIYTLSTNFISLPSVSSANIRALSSESDRIYRDTRPDSATQFYVVFYDDSGFRRPRAVYQGMPVCGTVPYAVGDTYDLSPADIAQWYNGTGNESRNVYLQIIASKMLSSNQSIAYNVSLPGTVDYLNQTAEFVDTLGGVPIYRGVFTIYQNNAPTYMDGIGYLDVYIRETRYKALGSKIRVLGGGKDELYGVLTSTGIYPIKYGINALDGSIIVDAIDGSPPYYDLSVLPAKIIVDAIDGSAPYYDIGELKANIIVTHPLHYNISVLPGDIDVHSLGRSNLNAIITTVSGGYGSSVLTARLTVVDSPETEPAWYDAKNWDVYGPSQEDRTVYYDTVNDNYITGATKIAIGSRYYNNGSILNSSGNVWSWGRAEFTGYNHTGASDDFLSLRTIGPGLTFTDIKMERAGTTSELFTLALKSTGEIYAWGANRWGIFGAFSTSSQTPADISDALSFKKINAGLKFAVSIDSTDHIRWKGNVLNAGVAVTTWTLEPTLAASTYIDVVAGSYYILALDGAGSVYKVGQFNSEGVAAGVLISGAHVFTKIVGDRNYAIGMKADGTIWGWGDNTYHTMGYTFASNYTNSPVQITDIPDTVDDITAGGFYSGFLCGNNVYVLGGDSGSDWYSGILTDVNKTREDRDSTNIISKVRPLNSWRGVFAGDIFMGVIGTSGDHVYINHFKDEMDNEMQFTGYQKIGAFESRTSLSKVSPITQDLWGGHATDRYYTSSGGGSTIMVGLPNLTTHFTRNVSSSPVITNMSGPSRFSMSADELSDSNPSNSIVAVMNDIYTGSKTNWILYQQQMAVGAFRDIFTEDYTNFPWLYMMMNADSTKFSPFKQRSYYPYDKVNYGFINYPFAYSSSNLFNVTVNYIVNNLSGPVTPFDPGYSLNGIGWSESYTSLAAKIGVYAELYDETVGYCIGTTKTSTLSASSRSVSLKFGIGDFTPTPVAADAITATRNTYPVKIKILIQPNMNFYDYNSGQSLFVSPTTWVEITNIRINPIILD